MPFGPPAFLSFFFPPQQYNSIWHIIPFAGIDALRDYTPDGGVYFSEVST